MIECLVCELSLHHCSYLKSAVESAAEKKIVRIIEYIKKKEYVLECICIFTLHLVLHLAIYIDCTFAYY